MEQFSRSKQRAWEAGAAVLSAFMNKDGSYEAVTWNQILERSKLSKGALSKYLPKLIEQGYVRGEVRVIDGKLINYYFLANPQFGTSYGMEEQDQNERTRVYINEYKKPVFAQILVKRSSRKVGKGENKKIWRAGPLIRPLAEVGGNHSKPPLKKPSNGSLNH